MKKKTVTSLLSILIFLSLSGCVKKESQDKINTTPVIESTDEEEIETNEKGVLNKDNVDLSLYKNELNNIKSTYNYPEYYMTIEQAEKLIADANTTKECTKDKNITYTDIYHLLRNNAKQSDNSPYNYLKNKTENIDFDLIIYKAVYNAFKETSDIHEDYCALEDVTIIIEDRCEQEEEGYLTTGEYIHDKKIIKLYYESILECYNSNKEYAFENNELYLYDNLENYFASVLQHEINHVRQWACECRVDAGQQIDKLDIFGFSLVESTAEAQLCYENVISKDNVDFDRFDFSYRDERETQAYIMLYGLLKDNFSHETFNYAIFNTDLKQFLEIYDIKSPEELVEFYNFTYTLETLNSRSPLAYDLITNYSPTIGEFREMIGYTHKIYLFKNNIKDLMNKVYNEEISLKESIYLYQFFKAYAVMDAYKLEKNEAESFNYIYDETFMLDIIHLENTYYKFLADLYTYNLEEFKEYTENNCFKLVFNTLDHYEQIADELSWDWENFYDVYIVVKNMLEKYPEIKEISFHISHFGGNISDFEEMVEKNNLTSSLVRDK